MADSQRYTKVVIVLHWTTAVLFFIMLAIGWSLDEKTGTDLADGLYYHALGGLIILVLSILRISWRIGRPLPVAIETSPRLKRIIKFAHLAIYSMLFIVPITGILTLAAHQTTVFVDAQTSLQCVLSFLGDRDFTLKRDVHAWAIYVVVILVFGHIGAAFFHKLWYKDGLIRRILPSNVKRWFMFVLMKRLRIFAVLFLLLIAGVMFVGIDLSRLQAGLVAPSEHVLLAFNSGSDETYPKPIQSYSNFHVNVTPTLQISIYARESERAKANVFLVHGAGGGAWVWEYFFEYIPEEFNLYALSWRGHFDSATVADANTRDYVSDQSVVLSAIKTRNNLPVHIVGHSYGGATAVLQTSQSSDEIASITLLAPVVPLNYTVTQRLLIPIIAPLFIQNSNHIEGVYGGMFLNKDRMSRYHSRFARHAFSEEKRSLIAVDGVSASWQTTLSMAYQNVADRGIPLSFFVATYDNVVAPSQQINLARQIDAPVTKIQSGHYLPLDAAVEELITTISNSLNKL